MKYHPLASQFPRGSRVRLSPDDRVRPRSDPNRVATVVGYSREPDCIIVIFDGNKTRECWHYTYWQLIEEKEKENGEEISNTEAPENGLCPMGG